MKFTIASSSTANLTVTTAKSSCVVLPIFEKGKLANSTSEFDKASGGLVQKLIKSGDIKGKSAECTLLHHPAGMKAERVILLGLGDQKGSSISNLRKALQALFACINKTASKSVHLYFSEITVEGKEPEWVAEQAILAAAGSTYSYQETKSKKTPAPSFKQFTLVCDGKVSAAIKASVAQAAATAEGVAAAKELGNLPGNICTPSYLAKQAKALARKSSSLSVNVLSEKQMADLGMGSLLSVSAGSKEPAQLIVMNYQGGAKSKAPTVLVGKGITFDTGGISLKPGAGMDEMKFDMCGAASVMGVITALTELKPKINVIGVIAAAENMPSGKATKPGDIVTSMAGKTIEILNTDAEGRLVLCDALTYVERFKPAAVIDIATLTGACVVALGAHASGLYSNRDELAAKLLSAGESAGDRAWHMPLWDEYKEQLSSNFADLANIGGPGGGSVTAACFLSHFTESYPWAHLDIAGTAWLSGNAKGATGRPVPLLMNYLINNAK
ncbi:leucyl aminopeptidase [Aurantivibrio plasticivorans]